MKDHIDKQLSGLGLGISLWGTFVFLSNASGLIFTLVAMELSPSTPAPPMLAFVPYSSGVGIAMGLLFLLGGLGLRKHKKWGRALILLANFILFIGVCLLALCTPFLFPEVPKSTSVYLGIILGIMVITSPFVFLTIHLDKPKVRKLLG